MKWLKPVLFPFRFFNPIVLLILFKCYWIAILVLLLIFVSGYSARDSCGSASVISIVIIVINLFRYHIGHTEDDSDIINREVKSGFP